MFISLFHFMFSATIRECFKTEVLLGSLANPLRAAPSCEQRDITEDGSGSTTACLCNTSFCNGGTDDKKGKEKLKDLKKSAKKFTQAKSSQLTVLKKEVKTKKLPEIQFSGKEVAFQASNITPSFVFR